MAGGMMYETFGNVTDRILIQCASPAVKFMVFVFLLPASPPQHQIMISAEPFLTARQASWPPQNPAHASDDSNGAVALPDSPWTYENGSLNPILEPSNAQLRRAASVAKKRKHRPQNQDHGRSSQPPYHPDYDGVNVVHTLEDDDSSSGDSRDTTPFVRGGSEGYEVHSIDREEMLRRYLMELGQEPGRYHRYVPSPDSDTDEEWLLSNK